MAGRLGIPGQVTQPGEKGALGGHGQRLLAGPGGRYWWSKEARNGRGEALGLM